MPKVPFSRVFQFSSCLMGGLLSLKLYLLTSSLLFANTPEGAAAAVQTAAASKQGATGTSTPLPAAADQSSPSDAVAHEPATPTGNDAPCSGNVKCIGQQDKPELDTDPHVDEARQAVLEDLAGRTKQLDQESQQLETLKRSIEASQAILDERMKKYSQNQSSLATQAKEKQQLSDADVDRLVKIYEAMSPREAASIFNVLDLQVAVPVMIKMNPRKASAILAGMIPERAMMATQLLAGVPKKPMVARLGTNG